MFHARALREHLNLRNERLLPWSSGLRARLWFPSSRIRTRPKPLDFLCVKKSSARLPSEGKLNNLSHIPTLRHVKEPLSRGVLRADSEIPSTVPSPSLAEGSRAAWCDGASGDEWANHFQGVGYNKLNSFSVEDPAQRPLTFYVTKQKNANVYSNVININYKYFSQTFAIIIIIIIRVA
jgi:hypothetical protein